MEYIQRSCPDFSACGLNCGLCPRHYTQGASRCPGCAGEGFSAVHPPCGVLSCAQRHGLEYCYLCGEYPCQKYEGADLYDSFITHSHQLSDFEKARELGIEQYMEALSQKMGLLEQLLQGYDDGRRKGFYCLAVNLLELEDVRLVMEELAGKGTEGMDAKERAQMAVGLLEAAAAKRGVSLKLRKKPRLDSGE